MSAISQAKMRWFSPKTAIREFLKSSSLNRLHFSIIAFLSTTYVLQVGIFLSSIEELSPSPFSGAKKLKEIVYGLCFTYAFLYGVLQFISLLGWKIAQAFSGKGGLSETRLAISWWLVCTAPLGFLLLIFQFTFKHPEMVGVSVIDAIGFIGVPFFFLYGWVVLLRSVAEVHQFSLWKALSVCLITGFSIFLGIYLIVSSGFFR